MVNEPITEKKWEGLDQQLEDETFLDKIVVKEEEVANFPPELIHDFQENYSDAQREMLYQRNPENELSGKNSPSHLRKPGSKESLIRNPVKMISLAILKNPRITENEILKYAQQKNLSEDVILGIAKHQNG